MCENVTLDRGRILPVVDCPAGNTQINDCAAAGIAEADTIGGATNDFSSESVFSLFRRRALWRISLSKNTN